MTFIDRRHFLSAAATTCLSTAASSNEAAPVKNKKIKIGQIGTGQAHASSVFSELRQVTDDYGLVGIVENDPQRRKSLGDSYQGVKLISEEQLLNTQGLQAVVMETEVQDLLPTAHRCVEAGMTIHLDKPAGENLADFKNLLDEITRRKLHLQMGYIYRYHSAFQFCYQIVSDGWLGSIFEVHSVMRKKVGESSRKYLSRYSGGSMFEIGCHVIDATLCVLGKPGKTTAFARQTHPNRDPLVDNLRLSRRDSINLQRTDRVRGKSATAVHRVR